MEIHKTVGARWNYAIFHHPNQLNDIISYLVNRIQFTRTTSSTEVIEMDTCQETTIYSELSC